MTSPVRRCREDERADILEIVNAAAEAYRGVIPVDRWREPYMDAAELDGEIAAGRRVLGLRVGRPAGRRDGHPGRAATST